MHRESFRQSGTNIRNVGICVTVLINEIRIPVNVIKLKLIPIINFTLMISDLQYLNGEQFKKNKINYLNRFSIKTMRVKNKKCKPYANFIMKRLRYFVDFKQF